ncbi:MAG: hypothetical protein KatS3mg129_2431 [Leptospiraceae bacterium]|nr:MAG: hypothetical protein KatS3mg129_2431 [Leptospiraceae bacterium]
MMYLKLKSLLKRYIEEYYFSIPDKHKFSYRIFFIENNLKVLYFLCHFLLLISSSVLFIFYTSIIKTGRCNVEDIQIWCYGVSILHCFFILLSVIYIFLYLLHIEKEIKNDKNKLIHSNYYYLEIFYIFIISLIGTLFTIVGQVYHGTITIYIIAILAVATMPILPRKVTVLIFLFNYIVFITGMILLQHNFDKLIVNLVNGSVATVVSYLLSIVLFKYRTTDYIKNQELLETTKELYNSNKQVRELLLNIFPEKIAVELETNKYVEPRYFSNVSVLFADFTNFTQIADKISPKELIDLLNFWFSIFDDIVEKYKLTKIKTIGDAYMCVGGLPEENFSHPVDICLCALEMRKVIKEIPFLLSDEFKPLWNLRIGIHTGSVIAGVIGKTRFTYDVWGDTVNLSSRLEHSSEPGKINISKSLYDKINSFFDCSYRGRIYVKGKGEIDMYYLESIKEEYSQNNEGIIPNNLFWEKYKIQ